MSKSRNTLHGAGGKFTTEPLRTPSEMEQHLIKLPNGCWLPPPQPTFGYIKGHQWFTTTGLYTPTGRKKMEAIHITLHKAKYAHSLINRPTTAYNLTRFCNTPGCANPDHYEVTNRKRPTAEVRKHMDRLIALFDAALQHDETITFSDESAAISFRAHVYRRKRKWKETLSPLWTQYKDIKIVQEKTHPDTLVFTTNTRLYDDVLAMYGTKPEDIKDEPLDEQFIPLHRPTQDVAADALRKAGFTTTAPKTISTPTYDEIYDKACRGLTLTSEEEEILNEGPAPEPAPPTNTTPDQ